MNHSSYLEYLDVVVDYALKIAMDPSGESTGIKDSLAYEVRHIVKTVRLAQLNRHTIPWDSRTYDDAVRGQTGSNLAAEATLRRQFPPVALSLSDPAVLEDAMGQIVAYYLPDVFLAPRQIAIGESMVTLEPTLREHWLEGSAKDSSAAWRNAEKHFLAGQRAQSFGRGNVTASPAWHMQARVDFEAAVYVSSHLGPGPGGKPASKGQLAFQQFIRDHLETGCLISVALALTHPEQYALTRAGLERLSGLRHICDHIRGWAFAFNVVTVVANRASPWHRDRLSGGPAWLDLLLSIGGDADTVLELPGIGVRFLYTSGTIALFCGHTHLHGVSACKGERVCFAAYARPSVLRQLMIHTPQPPTLDASLCHGYWLQYISDVVQWARS